MFSSPIIGATAPYVVLTGGMVGQHWGIGCFWLLGRVGYTARGGGHHWLKKWSVCSVMFLCVRLRWYLTQQNGIRQLKSAYEQILLKPSIFWLLSIFIDSSLWSFVWHYTYLHWRKLSFLWGRLMSQRSASRVLDKNIKTWDRVQEHVVVHKK